ncbi:MAG: molybdopterin-dependent oxidoreductase [Pseudomonadaceae bacterium]|nr:molybdopterin-dependent oxidoreductase [Pseudomonadaceae bacterium]
MSTLESTPGADGEHHTYCRLCEAQCGLIASVSDGKITKVSPNRDHPVSRGHLCVKAPGMLEVTYDPDRVLTPLKRIGGPGEFAPCTWDEALEDIAHRLTTITETHGGDSLAAYIGNPAAFATMHYAYGYTFTSLFGSQKRYNAMQVDTGARVLASDLVFGNAALTPFPDLPDTDFLMIFGGNPVISKMSLICAPRHLQQLDAISKRGGVIVVDPRCTETAERFEHQPINPDSDAWLLTAMLKTMVELDLIDAEATDRVNGWPSLRGWLDSVDMTLATERCGIEAAAIERLARRFCAADSAVCYARLGANRGTFSTLANVLMDAINLCTGNFGKAGGSLIGQSPFQPENSPSVAERHGARRSRIGDLPLVSGINPAGEIADDILTPGQGQLRAFFVDCGNPVLSHPDEEKMRAALNSLELLVCLDFYANETAQYAHYILPTPTFYERSDINDLWAANAPEPWLHAVEAVIEPRGASRHEWQIYGDIAKRAGKPAPTNALLGDLDPTSEIAPPLAIADSALTQGPLAEKGMSIGKLLMEHPGGYRISERMSPQHSMAHVNTDDGKPQIWNDTIAAECKRLSHSKSEHNPSELKLFGRRQLSSMNSWMHNSPRLSRSLKPTLLMHPVDAGNRQISDGQSVSVRSKTGDVDVTVELSSSVVEGSVCYPHGFGHSGGWQRANALGGVNINRLASAEVGDFEPISGQILLDGIPVEVRPSSIPAAS